MAQESTECGGSAAPGRRSRRRSGALRDPFHRERIRTVPTYEEDPSAVAVGHRPCWLMRGPCPVTVVAGCRSRSLLTSPPAAGTSTWRRATGEPARVGELPWAQAECDGCHGESYPNPTGCSDELVLLPATFDCRNLHPGRADRFPPTRRLSERRRLSGPFLERLRPLGADGAGGAILGIKGRIRVHRIECQGLPRLAQREPVSPPRRTRQVPLPIEGCCSPASVAPRAARAGVRRRGCRRLRWQWCNQRRCAGPRAAWRRQQRARQHTLRRVHDQRRLQERRGVRAVRRGHVLCGHLPEREQVQRKHRVHERPVVHR